MKTDRAICTNHRTAWPSGPMADALGFTWTRSLVYNLDEWMAQVDALDRARIKHVALMHSENEQINHDFAPIVWERVAEDWVQRHGGRIRVVEVLNEWDLLGLAPETVAAIVRTVAPIFRNAGIMVLLGSVAGGTWPAALQAAVDMLGPGSVDGCALHPYGQKPSRLARTQRPTFGTLKAAIQQAHNIAQMPVWLTESGVQLDDMLESFDPTGEEGQERWVRAAIQDCDELGNNVCPLWAMFSYADAMNSSAEHGLQAFGLFDDEWKPRPAASAYAQIADGTGDFSFLGRGSEIIEPRFQQGFAKWAALEPELIREPLENEFGAGQGWTTQMTSNGRLQWVQGAGHGFIDLSLRLYRWQEDWTHSIEVKQ